MNIKSNWIPDRFNVSDPAGARIRMLAKTKNHGFNEFTVCRIHFVAAGLQNYVKIVIAIVFRINMGSANLDFGFSTEFDGCPAAVCH